MRELNFQYKRKPLTPEGDVLVAKHKTRDGTSDTLAIRFRAGKELKISTTGALVFAIDGERIYFKEANLADGYRLSPTSQQVPAHKIQAFVPKGSIDRFVGNYDLVLDRVHNLYYIDTRHKL